jgi:hypothetical protein
MTAAAWRWIAATRPSRIRIVRIVNGKRKELSAKFADLVLPGDSLQQSPPRRRGILPASDVKRPAQGGRGQGNAMWPTACHFGGRRTIAIRFSDSTGTPFLVAGL